jgi:NAD(P)H-hydrate epimerase
MTLPLAEESPGQFAEEAALELLAFMAIKNKPLGFGPGLGLGAGAISMAKILAQNAPNPVVLDADALTALAGNPELLANSKGPRIVTPHPGEAGRLLGISSAEIEADRFGAALALAEKTRAVVLLKGRRTLIVNPETGQILVNGSGGPILAVGGSGDILTGLVTGFLAQGLPPFKAAALAAYAHGRAGDLATARFGARGIFPQETAAFLPEALGALTTT